MKKELDPQETTRAKAFRLWMNSPMPMVTLTKTTSQTCQDFLDDDAAKVGTSAVTGTELDCIVNQYGVINNPFLAWGKYRKGWLKTTLPISFQFHHVQMDGGHVCRFLNNLQDEINRL